MKLLTKSNVRIKVKAILNEVVFEQYKTSKTKFEKEIGKYFKEAIKQKRAYQYLVKINPPDNNGIFSGSVFYRLTEGVEFIVLSFTLSPTK